jgi:hypothetical protein
VTTWVADRQPAINRGQEAAQRVCRPGIARKAVMGQGGPSIGLQAVTLPVEDPVAGVARVARALPIAIHMCVSMGGGMFCCVQGKIPLATLATLANQPANAIPE